MKQTTWCGTVIAAVGKLCVVFFFFSFACWYIVFLCLPEYHTLATVAWAVAVRRFPWRQTHHYELRGAVTFSLQSRCSSETGWDGKGTTSARVFLPLWEASHLFGFKFHVCWPFYCSIVPFVCPLFSAKCLFGFFVYVCTWRKEMTESNWDECQSLQHSVTRSQTEKNGSRSTVLLYKTRERVHWVTTALTTSPQEHFGVVDQQDADESVFLCFFYWQLSRNWFTAYVSFSV